MVKVPKDLPRFKDEEEEAQWYAEHPEFFERMFKEAAATGRLKKTVKTPAERLAMAQKLQEEVKKAQSVNITIRLQRFELERAKRLAEQKNLRYQTYIKLLLHDALNREEQSIPRP